MLSLDQIRKSTKAELFAQAVTHSSTGRPQHNERLEFLGDAVLDLVVSEYLWQNQAVLSEGRMSQLRAATVREETLASAARALKLGNCLRLGRGEEQGGGRERSSLLADAMEAVIAAYYLSNGLDATRQMVLELFAPWLKEILESSDTGDYKSQFQELVQSREDLNYEYKLLRQQGPDHDKTFWVELSVNGSAVAVGTGKTKKQAEQHAARLALSNRL